MENRLVERSSRVSVTISGGRTGVLLGLVPFLLFLAGCAAQTRVLDITELAPPRQVSASFSDGRVVVRWQPSLDEQRPQFAGYNVYVSTSSLLITALAVDDRLPQPLEVGKVHQAILADLEPGARYFIQVRSRLRSGRISIASLPEVVVDVPPAQSR